MENNLKEKEFINIKTFLIKTNFYQFWVIYDFSVKIKYF